MERVGAMVNVPNHAGWRNETWGIIITNVGTTLIAVISN